MKAQRESSILLTFSENVNKRNYDEKCKPSSAFLFYGAKEKNILKAMEFEVIFCDVNYYS